MINISYSSINALKECPRSWLNKCLGLEKETFDYFLTGREAHNKVQKHISGQELHPNLAKLIDSFPLVETCDFDPKMKFEYPINDKYLLIGYLDGLDPARKRFCEIKTGAYSFRDFVKSYQRKIYKLVHPELTEAVLIKTDKDLTGFESYSVPLTDKDAESALKWVLGGIEIMESMDFHKLEKSNCHRCVYRSSCDESSYV